MPRDNRRSHDILALFGTVLAASNLALLAGCTGQAEVPLDLDFARESRRVTDGLSYVHLRSAGTDGRAPLSAHLLRVDLNRIEARVALAHDRVLGRETTSEMARRLGAIAAINGGFFIVEDPGSEDLGDPNGFLAVGGAVVSDPVMPRASFGLCDDGKIPQRTVIVRPRVETRVRDAGGGELLDITVRGRNRGRIDDDLVLYTPGFGPTTPENGDVVEAVVAAGRVVRVDAAGANAIPDNGYVLSASGAHVDPLIAELPVGREIELETAVTSLDEQVPEVPLQGCSYLSAGPRIVAAGVPIEHYELEEFRDAFTFERHPRTAVGTSADGTALIVLVVDGRQPALSGGMTLPELARLMVAEGAWDAYNLDGGGSSTMVVQDSVMNSPSDGSERPNSDGLLLFPRSPATSRSP